MSNTPQQSPSDSNDFSQHTDPAQLHGSASLALTKAQITTQVWQLVASVVGDKKGKADVAILSPRVEEILSLLAAPSSQGYVPWCLALLTRATLEHVASTANLLGLAKVAVRFVQCAPNRGELQGFEELLFPSCKEPARRAVILEVILNVSPAFHEPRMACVSASAMLLYLADSIRVFSADQFPAVRIPVVSSLVGTLIGSRGSLDGVAVLLDVCREQQFWRGGATQSLFAAGISQGDDLSRLGIAVKHALQVAAFDQVDRLAKLFAGWADDSLGPVAPILEQFVEVCQSEQLPGDIKTRGGVYLEILESLKSVPARLQNVTVQYVFTRIGAGPAFENALSQHLHAALELRKDSPTPDPIAASIDTILSVASSVYPDDHLMGFLGKLLPHLRDQVRYPDRVGALLVDMMRGVPPTDNAWCELGAVIQVQIGKGGDLDRVLASAIEIWSEPSSPKEREAKWTAYVDLVAFFEKEVLDVGLITPALLPSSLSQGLSNSHLSLVLECARKLREHDELPSEKVAELPSRLLRQGDLLGSLPRAVSHDRALGFSDAPIISAYSALTRGIPKEAVETVKTLVTYQHLRAEPLRLLLTNLVSMETWLLETERGESDGWKSVSALVHALVLRGVPLTFLNVEHLKLYLESEAREEVVSKISVHIAQISALFQELCVNGRAYQEELGELFSRIASQGHLSPGVRVVDALLHPTMEGHEALSTEALIDLWSTGLPSTDAWHGIAHGIHMYRERGYLLQGLCHRVTLLSGEIEGKFQSVEKRVAVWRSIAEITAALQDTRLPDGSEGLPFTLLSTGLVVSFHESSHQELLQHLISGVTLFFRNLAVQADWESPQRAEALEKSMRDMLADMASYGFGLTDNPAMVHKLKLILAEGGLTTFEQMETALRDLKLHALTDIMRNSSDEARKEWARKLIATEFSMGGPPYVTGSPQAHFHFNQSFRVIDRAFRDNKGFGGSALDCRSPPRCSTLESVPPLMVRFGLESAKDTYILNASRNDKFPGKGICISNLKINRLFSPDPKWREHGKESPYWRWLEGKGLFASDYFHKFNMEEFAECSFIKMRGLEIVLPPSTRRHVLDGIQYAYLFYNRHFAPFPEVALGVPVVVIRELLGDALIPAEDFTGFDRSRTDLSMVDFSYQGLLRACEKRGVNLLNLTYGSVVGGGLCNAYLPGSSPHYQWEVASSASDAWRDSWQHIHKAWLLPMNARSSRDLAFARTLQEKVYDVFHSLQDYSAGFRFALSFYKMGTTATSDQELREVERANDEDSDGREREEEGQPTEDDNELNEIDRPVHEYRYRMLEEFYRWHLGAKEQGWPRGQFPELHFALTLDPNSIPPDARRKFVMDTFSMTLTTRAGKISLPTDSDGRGEEERRIWREYVLPYLEEGSTGWDPRLLLREGAFTIYE